MRRMSDPVYVTEAQNKLHGENIAPITQLCESLKDPGKGPVPYVDPGLTLGRLMRDDDSGVALGDEFIAVAMPATPLRGARRTAERIASVADFPSSTTAGVTGLVMKGQDFFRSVVIEAAGDYKAAAAAASLATDPADTPTS